MRAILNANTPVCLQSHVVSNHGSQLSPFVGSVWHDHCTAAVFTSCAMFLFSFNLPDESFYLRRMDGRPIVAAGEEEANFHCDWIKRSPMNRPSVPPLSIIFVLFKTLNLSVLSHPYIFTRKPHWLWPPQTFIGLFNLSWIKTNSATSPNMTDGSWKRFLTNDGWVQLDQRRSKLAKIGQICHEAAALIFGKWKPDIWKSPPAS